MPSYAERYPLSDASDNEEDCVLRWRDEQFRALGFEPSEALVLAVSKADLHSVIDQLPSEHLKADAYVDLCYGYLDLEQYETARRFGEMSLAIAGEPRQVRNAHYLLGEAAYKMGDVDAAEDHFEHLARFYPQFRHLKSLLFAIDLRSMLNLKL